MALRKITSGNRLNMGTIDDEQIAKGFDVNPIIDAVNLITNGAGVIALADGTAAAPAIHGTTSVSTGIHFGSSTISFDTAGNERVKIDAQGDININGGAGIEGGATGVGTYWSTFAPLAVQQTIASANTAIAVDSYLTTISNGGGTTHAMADGKVIGQMKKIVGVGALAAGAVITPSNLKGAATTLTLSVIGDTIELIWDGTDWNAVALYNTKNGVITSPVMA